MEPSKKSAKRARPLPETGYLRIWQIIGKPADEIPAIIPISKSKLWADVKAGKFPAPTKLGERTTAWRVEAIRSYIDGTWNGEG